MCPFTLELVVKPRGQGLLSLSLVLFVEVTTDGVVLGDYRIRHIISISIVNDVLSLSFS